MIPLPNVGVLPCFPLVLPPFFPKQTFAGISVHPPRHNSGSVFAHLKVSALLAGEIHCQGNKRLKEQRK